MSSIPDKVVRFYGSLDYALECIAFKEITLIHVDKFNDPFDPVLEFYRECDNYPAFLDYAQKHHPDQLDEFKARLPEADWEGWGIGLKEMADKYRKGMFVFSTCAVNPEIHPKDNLYMWGHYGNGHRGVAIEFDTTVLANPLPQEGSSEASPHWWEMLYCTEIEKVPAEHLYDFVMKSGTPLEEEAERQIFPSMEKQLRAKGKVWEKENEWRFVLFDDETRLKIRRQAVSGNAITAVYLGCRAGKEDDFLHETKRNFPSARVFKARMKHGDFALDFDELTGSTAESERV